MWHSLSLRAKPYIFTELFLKMTSGPMGGASEMNRLQTSGVRVEDAERWGITS